MSDFTKAKKEAFDRLYKDLNDRQKEAVYSVNGPLLVIAGAGSGKTTVLVNRISHIINYGDAYYDTTPAGIDGGVEELLSADGDKLSEILKKYACSPCPPWAMMAITFTNKAANEIKERLVRTVGEDAATEICAGTFHSVCMRILRKFADRAGYRSGMTIYDSEDSKKLIASVIKDKEIDEKMYPVKNVMNRISRAKEKLLTPDDFASKCGIDYKLITISEIYKEYQNRLKAANALDFDDIIMQTVSLLENCEDVRDYYQHRYKYVCIDEFQDTNYAQFRLAVLLSGKYRNLMVVGDDDQSIYRFRGATIENILNFDETFKDAKVIKLEQNYRSTQTILNAANAIISNNDNRRKKTLWTENGSGEKIVLKCLDDQESEARYIAKTILDLKASGEFDFSDFAILYRMNAQSQSLETVFAKSGVPYRIYGGHRFTDRKEVKDIVAYLNLIVNPADDLRLVRIINEPKRKIGSATVEAVQRLASYEHCSMYDILFTAGNYDALARSVGKLQDFAILIQSLKIASEALSVSEIVEKTIKDSGYENMLLDMGVEGEDKLNNVREIISMAKEFEADHDEPTLESFLEEYALISDIDNYDSDADAVVMMTIHSAKGLEYPCVFLPGFEEDMFPSAMSKNDDKELQEERRLAYVAVTRAKNRLFITHTSMRILFGKTQYNAISRFALEIPREYCKLDPPKQIPEKERIRRKEAEEAARAFDFRKPSAAAPSSGTGYKKPLCEKLEEGDRVSHTTFGEGRVMKVTPLGPDCLYEVNFDNHGLKKMMGSFAKLKKIQ